MKRIILVEKLKKGVELLQIHSEDDVVIGISVLNLKEFIKKN